ncbi:MAG TPA: hypothetical protein VMR98_04845 [Candidatus Polarisedimenticolaceae bacterium]|nr:hypothetical protein [Candidatus Polarisedimenticolaceae bacterium]
MISTPFIQFAEQFTAANPVIKVTGEYYDLPGQTVYTTATHKLKGGGRIEVNTTTENTPDDFEWKHEITVNDKVEKRFIHLIVRHDNTIVETYGKTILPVSQERATEIMTALAELLKPAV